MEAVPSFVLRGGNKAAVHAGAVDAEGAWALSGDEAGEVLLWELTLKRPTRVGRPAHAGSILTVGFVDATTILTQGRDQVIKLWRLAKPEGPAELVPDGTPLVAAEEIRRFRVGAAAFCRAAWLVVPSTGQLLVAAPARDDCEIEVWDGRTGRPVGETLEARLSIPAAAKLPTPDGEPARHGQGLCMALVLFAAGDHGVRLLAGWEDGRVGLWHLGTRQCLSEVAAHREPVLCMALHAPTGQLWTGSAERTIGHFALVDDATTLAPREKRLVKVAGLNAIAVRSDARIVATAGWDGRLRLFGARSWKPLVSVAYHRSGSLHDVAFQPGGPLLAAASHDTSVSLWTLYGMSTGT